MTMPSLPGVRRDDERYELLERRTVHQGGFFRVLEDRARLPNGAEVTQEVLHYPAAVAVIAVARGDDGEPELVLVEQFRPSVAGYIHEIPAGMLESDEDPLGCARRELEEETGLRAARWTHVTTLLQTPGLAPARLMYFLAEEIETGGAQRLEESECLQVRRYRLDDLIEVNVFGREVEGVPTIVDTKAQVALYYLAAVRERERRQ